MKDWVRLLDDGLESACGLTNIPLPRIGLPHGGYALPEHCGAAAAVRESPLQGVFCAGGGPGGHLGGRYELRFSLARRGSGVAS